MHYRSMLPCSAVHCRELWTEAANTTQLAKSALWEIPAGTELSCPEVWLMVWKGPRTSQNGPVAVGRHFTQWLSSPGWEAPAEHGTLAVSSALGLLTSTSKDNVRPSAFSPAPLGSTAFQIHPNSPMRNLEKLAFMIKVNLTFCSRESVWFFF